MSGNFADDDQLALLAPIELSVFLSDYWEKQPLHISRSRPDYFESLLSVRAMEAVLSSRPLYFPDVQLTQSGQAISSSDYADAHDRILPLRLARFHAEGATLIMSRAQNLFPELSELCTEVARVFDARSQTNVYLSAPGKQGFNAHYDTHDVFILQVSGSKTFHFYPSSTHLPMTDESFDVERVTPAPKDDSVPLEAGDTLYIPRGMVHDAIADESSPSLHITLGIYPLLVKQLLQDVIQLAAENNVEFRRSLSGASMDTKQLHSMLAASVNDSTMQTAMSRFKDELALDLPQFAQGSLSAVKFNDNQSVCLRANVVLNAEPVDQGIKLRLPGQIVIYEAHYQRIIELLLKHGKLDREDVSDLNDEQYRSAIERFHCDSLIEIV